MSFIENPRFPIDIAYGSAGGPGFSTSVVVLESGFENRNQNWQEARHRYDVAGALRKPAQLGRLVAFFRMVKGRAHGFRFRDWADYGVWNGSPPAGYWGVDGSGVLVSLGSDQWQFYKRYTNESGDHDRIIQKPVSGKTTVYAAGDVVLVPGSDYTIDTTTGIITMIDSPATTPVKWRGEFDVPCRFDTDQMITDIEGREAYRWGQIPIVEIRV